MSREIRITIDDDEVFERMKRRKEALDLSWEETLRRGLDQDGRGPSDSHETHTTLRRPPTPPAPHDPRRHHRRRGRGRAGRESDDRAHDEFGPGHDDFGDVNPFDPEFQERLRAQIESSVQESLSGVETAMRHVEQVTGGLGDEIDRLSDAEDAVLTFADLPDDPEHQVPLRVNLATSADGLDVEVVTIRQGKGTDGMNRFAQGDRKTITETVATGGTGLLRLQDGAEEYAVVPRLTWGRTPDGEPTVTGVEIVDVVFGE
ncbi:hypothetical protein [Haloarchaeobius sp. DYHT-AS-18]|uniref:hypothetical protein n=1 Tax=Haloarchaeobius sp. DYHT-AS-18 TaxID=3446117 RepID=UPI003EBCF823